MNLYVILGSRANAVVRSIPLNKPAQDELTALFARLSEEALAAEQIPFDPGYRAADGEVIVISDYELPARFSALESSDTAEELEAVTESEVADGTVRGVLAVAWKAGKAKRIIVQRIDARYILRPESFRLFLANQRFVRDERPGFEITERIDAVLQGSDLYVTSWVRAHSVLDLSAWVREATLAEAESFVNNSHFTAAAGFDLSRVIDATVRRKITSITQNGVVGKATPKALQEYAAKFKVSLDVEKGRIVLPADKKQFKAVLSLLDQDLLAFEPTDEHWIVNSKRRPS